MPISSLKTELVVYTWANTTVLVQSKEIISLNLQAHVIYVIHILWLFTFVTFQKVANKNNVDRMTDTSKYTGAHKERFDKDGKGKGARNISFNFNNLQLSLTISDQI